MAIQIPPELFTKSSDILLNWLQNLRKSALQGMTQAQQENQKKLEQLLTLNKAIFTTRYSKEEPLIKENGTLRPLTTEETLAMLLGLTPKNLVWKERETERMPTRDINQLTSALRSLAKFGKATVVERSELLGTTGKTVYGLPGVKGADVIIKKPEDLEPLLTKFGFNPDDLRQVSAVKYYNQIIEKLKLKEVKSKEEGTKYKKEIETKEKKALKQPGITPKTREEKLKILREKGIIPKTRKEKWQKQGKTAKDYGL